MGGFDEDEDAVRLADHQDRADDEMRRGVVDLALTTWADSR